eukprot:120013_1
MRFRIGTLNVHWVVRPKRMDKFVKLVFDNGLDILIIQEAQTDAIQKFVNKLNEFEKKQSVNSPFKWTHASVMPTFLCNSIISKYPIMEQNEVYWDWLHFRMYKNKGSNERRCAVMAKILIQQNFNNKEEDIKMENNCNDNIISIMCTHLDHMDESCRLLQINHFLNNIMKTNNKTDIENKEIEYPDILCGDFNSLLQSDYTNKNWNKIVDIRIKNKWETPKSDLMYKLLLNENDKMRYFDTLETVLKQRFYKEKYLKNSKKK